MTEQQKGGNEEQKEMESEQEFMEDEKEEAPQEGDPDFDILHELARPFPLELVEWKPKGGIDLAIVPYWAYEDRLTQLFGQDWQVRIEFGPTQQILVPPGRNSPKDLPPDIREAPSVLVSIGLKLDDEWRWRSSLGEPDGNDIKQGNAAVNAEAQAFKRAAARWGLGRYMWKGPRGKDQTIIYMNNLIDRYGGAIDFSDDKVFQAKHRPKSPPAGGPQPITAQQIDEVNSLGQEFYEEEWVNKRSEVVDGISKKAAKGRVEGLRYEEADVVISALSNRIQQYGTFRQYREQTA